MEMIWKAVIKEVLGLVIRSGWFRRQHELHELNGKITCRVLCTNTGFIVRSERSSASNSIWIHIHMASRSVDAWKIELKAVWVNPYVWSDLTSWCVRNFNRETFRPDAEYCLLSGLHHHSVAVNSVTVTSEQLTRFSLRMHTLHLAMHRLLSTRSHEFSFGVFLMPSTKRAPTALHKRSLASFNDVSRVY